jgi:ribosomal protein L30E
VLTVRLLCGDVAVITERVIVSNWSDIVLHDKREKTYLLIDITTPHDLHVNIKYAAKLSKCIVLEIEVSRLWKVRTKTVPVIIGALETIKKGSVQNVRLHPSHPSAIELQKVTLMSTAHIIRKMLR